MRSVHQAVIKIIDAKVLDVVVLNFFEDEKHACKVGFVRKRVVKRGRWKIVRSK